MSKHSQCPPKLLNEAEINPEIEALARDLYERVRRDDTFDDLKRRAAFSRQDAGHLKHWIRAARTKAAERNLGLS